MRDENWATFWLIIAIFAFALAWTLIASIKPARAQHRHEDMPIHERFYATWMMPDNRNISCCHNEDCQPAEAYQKNGQWFARRDGDREFDFTPIPSGKVETERDTPDGRNHLCLRRYGLGVTVYCFIPGAGG